jgi:hypothetical protein
MGVFKKRMLRVIFGTKRKEMIEEGWRILHNIQRRLSYFTQNIA